MFKHIKSAISQMQNNVARLATVALCLALTMGLPMLPAHASSIQPIASIGLKHQAEGALQQGVGKAKEATGDLKGKAEGLARQADGKAKRDIGRVESKAEELARSGKKNATDLGEQIQDAAGSLADSVKDLVK
jgi:uncharacterized protein YjbJ (UPF0337 family)